MRLTYDEAKKKRFVYGFRFVAITKEEHDRLLEEGDQVVAQMGHDCSLIKFENDEARDKFLRQGGLK